MFHTNCGCPFCKRQPIPTSRAGWKARKNKAGRMYGSHCKGTHKRGRFKKGK